MKHRTINKSFYLQTNLLMIPTLSFVYTINWKMIQLITVNGEVIIDMVMEFRSDQTGQVMKDTGKIICFMEKVSMFIRMVAYMKAIG